MKAKRILFIIIICVLTLSATFIGGCVGDGNDEDGFVFDNKYNATLYDQAIDFDWFTEEYLADKLLNNCYYGDFSIWNNTVFRAEDETRIEGYTFPHEIVTVIDNQEKFDAAFKKIPQEIDFSKRVLVVNFYKTHLPKTVLEYSLESIELEGNSLKIDIRQIHFVWLGSKGEIAPDACAPYRDCFVVVLDKIDFDEVSIRRINKDEIVKS